MSSEGSGLLGPTERNLFERIIKCYESKDYKKGLQYSKTILDNPNYSNHGETICLKGLLMFSNGDDDGYKVCKQGLSKNLKSYMSWHILGLVERGRRNYQNALKCFKNAQNKGSKNLQILRDLGSIQIQLHDYEGYLDTRQRIHNIDSTDVFNAIGLAYAEYLVKNYESSFEILQTLLKNEKQLGKLSETDRSNLFLFEITLLLELKSCEKALEICKEKFEQIGDKERLLKCMASANKVLNNHEEEAQCRLRLVVLSPNNEDYIEEYAEIILSNMSNSSKDSSDIMEEEFDRKRVIYASMFEHLPDSFILKQKILHVSSGENFEVAFADYIRDSVSRKIPNAIKMLKLIYSNDEDVKIDFMEEELLALIEEKADDPQSLKWVYYFLASHYSIYEQYTDAFEFLNKALEIDFEMIDSLLLYARLFKCISNYNCANDIIRRVANNCLSDKFINSVTGKYLLYTNDAELADRFLQQFSRINMHIDCYMKTIQCLWYRIHKAFVFYRTNQFFEALHHVLIAESHFGQFLHDQFDFHNYCITNTLLEPFNDLRNNEIALRASKFNWNLVKVSVYTMLEIYDDIMHPGRRDAQNNSDCLLLTSKEKRALKFKALKEKQKSAKQNVDVPAKSNNTNFIKSKCTCPYADANQNCLIKLKLDYSNENGKKLILDHFLRIISYINSYFSKKFTAQLLLMDMYIRLDKPLLVLSTFTRIREMNPQHYKILIYQDRMLKYFTENHARFNHSVKSVIELKICFKLHEKQNYIGFINDHLINYLKTYENRLWNLVTYIIVAKEHNITSLISATFKTICCVLRKECDLFTYREMSKFRKFVLKHIPEHISIIDEIINTNYPIMFQKNWT